MTYGVAVVVWIGLAITTLVMNYPAHIKIVRMLADEENQGKIFGLNEAFVGVGAILINAVFLYVFARLLEGVAGLRGVIITMGIFSVVVSIVVFFMLRGTDSDSHEQVKAADAPEKIRGKDFVRILFSPATWLLGIGIFCVYSLSVTMSYFTPYVTAVLGGTVAFSGIVAIIRTYVVRLLGAPVGGYLTDKLKSVSKVLLVIYVCAIITLVMFLVLPVSTPMGIFILLMLLVALFVFMGKGIYYAVASELSIPRRYTATSVGIAAALGFSPDIFLFTLAGYWLDTLGDGGYRNMFIFQIVVLCVGLVGSFCTLRYKASADKRAANRGIVQES
jgi:Na+/melibiose symporter-like transporter